MPVHHSLDLVELGASRVEIQGRNLDLLRVTRPTSQFIIESVTGFVTGSIAGSVASAIEREQLHTLPQTFSSPPGRLLLSLVALQGV